MNRIDLSNLRLKTFTEQDVYDYCQINNINPNNIIELDLSVNELTDISGIKIFKNLKELWLYHNKITDISVIKDLNNIKILHLNNNGIKDISVIQYLNKLKELNINNLKLESDQIQYLNKNFKKYVLFLRNGFKDKTAFKQLNKNIEIYE